MNCGHFIHSKRFDLMAHPYNCQAQCVRCNKYLSGNLGKFANNLGKKYGYQILDKLFQLEKAKEKNNLSLKHIIVMAIINLRQLNKELEKNIA
jgi:hypothetical protein